MTYNRSSATPRTLSPSDRVKIAVFMVFWVASAVTLWADNHFGWDIFPSRNDRTLIYSFDQQVGFTAGVEGMSAAG